MCVSIWVSVCLSVCFSVAFNPFCVRLHVCLTLFGNSICACLRGCLYVLIGVGFVYDIDVGLVRVLGRVLVGAFVSGFCYLLV